MYTQVDLVAPFGGCPQPAENRGFGPGLLAIMDNEPYFEFVSAGVCEVLGCSNPAKYRALYAQGILTKLLCSNHKAELEGKLFEELSPSIFGHKRPTE